MFRFLGKITLWDNKIIKYIYTNLEERPVFLKKIILKRVGFKYYSHYFPLKP